MMKPVFKIMSICLTALLIISSCKKENPTYTLTVNVNPENSGTAQGAGIYQSGEVVNLIATPSADYEFVNWTIGDTEISTDASYEYTTTEEDVTITANFILKSYALTLSVSPEGKGTVTGGGNYNSGQVVNIVATPKIGYEFVNWKNGDVIVSSNANYAYTTASSNVTLTANFIEKQIIVTLGAQSNASIGAFYSIGQYQVYTQDLAFANQDTIDLLCFYEHIEPSKVNDITLSSPGANITNIFTGITSPDVWTTKRLTLFTPPATAITTAQFDLLHQNDPAIIAYFDVNVTSGNKKAKTLAADNIYAFKTHDNIYGLFKVISVVQGADGSCQFELKLAKQ